MNLNHVRDSNPRPTALNKKTSGKAAYRFIHDRNYEAVQKLPSGLRPSAFLFFFPIGNSFRALYLKAHYVKELYQRSPGESNPIPLPDKQRCNPYTSKTKKNNPKIFLRVVSNIKLIANSVNLYVIRPEMHASLQSRNLGLECLPYVSTSVSFYFFFLSVCKCKRIIIECK